MKETFMFTRNALYGVTLPTGQEGGQEGAEAHQTRGHEYEDVDVPKSTKRTSSFLCWGGLSDGGMLSVWS